MAKENVDYVVAGWDWRAIPLLEDGGGVLGTVLKKLGIHVYPCPSVESDDDQYKFIFSHQALTKKQIKKIDKENK